MSNISSLTSSKLTGSWSCDIIMSWMAYTQGGEGGGRGGSGACAESVGSTAWLLQCPYSEEELECEGIKVATGPEVKQPEEVL